MSKNATLNATKREVSGTSAAKRLRREGIVPGVVYGSRQDNYSIQLPAKQVVDLLHQSSSLNVLVNLKIEGAKEENKMAMIKAVQHHPLSGEIVHVDFHAVREDEEIHANVPVLLTGSPIGVKQGGLIDHQLHAVEVHCKPADLPAQLEVDVTDLDVGDAAHVKDIVVPEGVVLGVDGEVVVALVQEIRIGVDETEEAEEGLGEEGVEGEEGAEGAEEGEEKPAEEAS